MKALETLIPPPIVALVFALLIWGIARVTPGLHIDHTPRLFLAGVLLLTGVCFDLSGLLHFRLARTTINPTKPHKASSLVDSGIYRITRNPMYVGLVFVLSALCVYLAAPASLLAVAGFVFYINCLQIRPEERVLLNLFGDEYRQYQSRVRRWL